MRHCNNIFKPNDIWFLLDSEEKTERKLYLANCPVCEKKVALYSYFNEKDGNFYQKYFYSGGYERIKKYLKKDIVSTMLNFKNGFKTASGFKYGKNIEIKGKGKIVALEQYACDFEGNETLIKRIKMENEKEKPNYTISDAVNEFDELKKIALNCFDKNGNPNIATALKAVENKAKVMGLYRISEETSICFTRMGEITLDGEQLKLKTGENFEQKFN